MSFIIWKPFKFFLLYFDWCIKTPFRKCSIYRLRQNFVFPRSFTSNSFLKWYVVFVSSLGVSTRFKPLTYTTIIANLVSDFLMKMHEHIELFTYPFFSKYFLRSLYHMHLDCFNSYKDHCTLIEYMLRGFLLFASSNLNLSGVFMYISLSMDPYKYVIITYMRRIFSPSKTVKLIKKQNVIVHDGESMFPYSQYQFSIRNLVLLMVFYILWSHNSHCAFVQIPICT